MKRDSYETNKQTKGKPKRKQEKQENEDKISKQTHVNTARCMNAQSRHEADEGKQ